MFSTLRSTARPTPPTSPRIGRYRAAAAIGAAAGLVLDGRAGRHGRTGFGHEARDRLVGASSFSGTVNFSNRTVTLQGRLHAVGCRYVGGVAYAGTAGLDSDTTPWICNTDTTVTLSMLANQPGGADNADVILKATDGQARKNVHRVAGFPQVAQSSGSRERPGPGVRCRAPAVERISSRRRPP